MSTTSIADLNLDQPEEKITPATGSQALSTRVASGSDIQGEINIDDLNRPRINLVQKSSSDVLTEAFDYGDIVLNKTVRLAALNQPIDGIIVAKIRKLYQEKLEWDPSRAIQPKFFETAAEVRDAGGSTNWGDDHFYEKMAHILMIIPAPESATAEDKDELFFYEFESLRYALGVYTVAGTGYNDSARDILTCATQPAVVTKGIRLAKWQMKSFKKASPKNTWFGLSLKRSGSNSDELITWTKTIIP